MEMLKSKDSLSAEIQVLKTKLKNSRDQNSVLSDQMQMLQKECKSLLNSISAYEEANHKLSNQVSKLNEKNSHLKKKLRQSITACTDIKRQAEAYISSIQSRFYEQMSRMTTFVNNKKDSEETETTYSFNSLSQLTPFQYDSPAISVSEKENDSSIARHDSEEIIMAYTQEIKDKQIEVLNLNRNLNQKIAELEKTKANLEVAKHSNEEKDKVILNLQQEVKILNDLKSKQSDLDFIFNKQPKFKPQADDYNAQIETLQAKIANQNKKFENYIRTIANLEKQAQLQSIKYSELENINKSLTETSESEKKELLISLETLEFKIAELETLKIQQAKVINDQSSRLSNYKNFDENSSLVVSLRKKIENLEEENKKLVEVTNYIQEHSNHLISSKNNEIKDFQLENSKKIESLVQDLETKNKKIDELNLELSNLLSNDKNNQKPFNTSDWKKIESYLVEEFKQSNPANLLKALKDMSGIVLSLKYFSEEYEEKDYNRLVVKLKTTVSENKLVDIYFDDLNIKGTSLPEKLEALSSLLISLKSGKDPIDNAISASTELLLSDRGSLKQTLTRLIKDYSNNLLSIITKISNSVHKVNERLGNALETFNKQCIPEHPKRISLPNQIQDYEISTVNECSEKDDDSMSEDLESKVEMSAKRIKELTGEINVLRALLDDKQEVIYNCESKIKTLKAELDKKNKDCHQLLTKKAELETEIKTNKEVYEVAEKKKINTINTLENRLNSMKKEYDTLKNSIVAEKDELFDHIIRIEQESKSQTSW